jgi:hypothetical protein
LILISMMACLLCSWHHYAPPRTLVKDRLGEGAGSPQLGPRWGRSRAVIGRNASDNHGEPPASSVQLSPPSQPSTAGHSYQPIRSRTEEARGANPLTSTPPDDQRNVGRQGRRLPGVAVAD